MASHRRGRRVPTRELTFLAALLGAAVAVSWISGRTMVLHELFRPFLGAVDHVTGATNQTIDRVKDLRTLERDKARLEARVRELEALLDTRMEQGLENARLHDLLKLQLPTGVEPLVARVVGRNPDNWHQRIVLDAGHDRGVQLNGVVATRKGLVGRVVTLAANTAMVAFVTDPASAVSVLNTRNRYAGVMQGQGDKWPVLRYLERPDRWRIGDRLISSGLGGTFPKGLPVGRIVQLQNEKERPGTSVQAMLYADLRVVPAVDLDALEEVLVLPAGLPAMPAPPTPAPRPSPAAGDAAKPSAARPGAAPAKPAPKPSGTTP
ncbi:MAG: rod shape-determining protein MreC [Candidatus Sericytochromatia bacterium]|nr:rod shape-determining protein MreC [Candidatus Sericytochromatia bacterium]